MGSVVHSPLRYLYNSECIIEIELEVDRFVHWFHNLWVEGSYGWKSQMEVIGVAFIREHVNPKQYHIGKNCRD